MEDEIAPLHPPEKRIPRAAIALCVPLRRVQVDTDVRPVGDLEPISLGRVCLPPSVDLARHLCPVGIVDAETDPRRRRPDELCAWQGKQGRGDERAAVLERVGRHHHLTGRSKTVEALLDPRERNRLTVRERSVPTSTLSSPTASTWLGRPVTVRTV